MALWQADLRVSWRAQWISLLLHSVLILLILFSPWPLRYLPFWLLALVLVIFGFVRSQRRINMMHGEICLRKNNRIDWQNGQWHISKPPWMLQWGMLLVLRGMENKRRFYLWIMSDSMSHQQWRDLRYQLLQSSVTEKTAD